MGFHRILNSLGNCCLTVLFGFFQRSFSLLHLYLKFFSPTLGKSFSSLRLSFRLLDPNRLLLHWLVNNRRLCYEIFKEWNLLYNLLTFVIKSNDCLIVLISILSRLLSLFNFFHLHLQLLSFLLITPLKSLLHLSDRVIRNVLAGNFHFNLVIAIELVLISPECHSL